jgi:hypothetical protein
MYHEHSNVDKFGLVLNPVNRKDIKPVLTGYMYIINERRTEDDLVNLNIFHSRISVLPCI